MPKESQHTPVLLHEILEILKPKPGETVLDCTIGLGGHAEAFLEATSPTGKLIGMDADKENLEEARKRLARFGERVAFIHGNFQLLGSSGTFFRSLGATAPQRRKKLSSCNGWGRYDILFADLGLSSPHIDDPKRGFTYREKAPLDLRYDRTQGETGANLIRRVSERELTTICKDYGELRGARRLAQAIKEETVETTTDLRRVVEKVYGWRAPSLLPQVFQALRIATNDELGALKTLLCDGPKLLQRGGRMGVISYHSLEDRMVKHAFRALCTPPKDSLTGQILEEAPFTLLAKKPILPSKEERAENPRSRSAKFRAVLRQCCPPPRCSAALWGRP